MQSCTANKRLRPAAESAITGMWVISAAIRNKKHTAADVQKTHRRLCYTLCMELLRPCNFRGIDEIRNQRIIKLGSLIEFLFNHPLCILFGDPVRGECQQDALIG